MLLQHLELITNIQEHATPKEAGAVGETNFSSKIMCSVQFLLCTWMTLIPDEPSAPGFAGNRKTMALALKKIRGFQVCLGGTTQNHDSHVSGLQLESREWERREVYANSYCIGQRPPPLPLPGSYIWAVTPWMKMIHGAKGHHLIT